MLSKGMIEKDLEELYIAVEQDPGDIKGLFNIGIIQKEKHRYKTALKAFSDCNKTAPDDLEVLREIVTCYCRLEDFASAKIWNEKILKMCPLDEKVHKVQEKICERINN